MAKKHIAAYFLDDNVKKEALEMIGASAHATDAFVFGEADDPTISKLESLGLIVQDQTPPDLPSLAPAPLPRPQSTRGIMRSFRSALDVADPVPAEIDYYVLTLNGPLIEDWREQLNNAGVQIIEAVSAVGYKVRLNINDVPKVDALDFVQQPVAWIQPEQSTPQVMTRSFGSLGLTRGGAASFGSRLLTFDVRLHLPEDRPKIEQWLRDRSLDISGSTGRKIRFLALEDAPELDQLSALPEVDAVAEYIQPKLANQYARVLLGAENPPGHNPASYISQDGSGQIVAVADTGIDDQHPDLAGRIIGKVARGRPNDASDPHGHGTHVSGSILGDGSASGGALRGVAPKAQLFFQSLLDENGGLGGLPLDLNDLFQEAYQAGARIHNDSWCAETPSNYTLNSEEVDQFVHDHPDMLILIAAGNAASGAGCLRANQGFVDWLSIGSPASCKNALTVGASRSNRTDGPMAKVTWGQCWPTQFPDPPISNETVSGDPESLAAFSGRGPCDDYRIKPDIVAPGTDIASTRSSQAPISNFAGPYPSSAAPNLHYAYDCGTSMATPLTAGCATLVRQYFIQTRNHQPSAALLKATLINSATWLSGADSTAPKPGIPNYHQGHGRVNLLRAIPNASDPDFVLQFVDDWQNSARSFTRTGERRRYQFTLAQDMPELRVCLAYTDAPARALQNNLNLIVQHIQSAKRWIGNSSLPDALTALDTINNVESLRITDAPAGSYVLQVVASNLLKPPQAFALVVTGKAIPALSPIG
jgi:serine protease AprX